MRIRTPPPGGSGGPARSRDAPFASRPRLATRRLSARGRPRSTRGLLPGRSPALRCAAGRGAPSPCGAGRGLGRSPRPETCHAGVTLFCPNAAVRGRSWQTGRSARRRPAATHPIENPRASLARGRSFVGGPAWTRTRNQRIMSPCVARRSHYTASACGGLPAAVTRASPERAFSASRAGSLSTAPCQSMMPASV